MQTLGLTALWSELDRDLVFEEVEARCTYISEDGRGLTDAWDLLEDRFGAGFGSELRQLLNYVAAVQFDLGLLLGALVQRRHDSGAGAVKVDELRAAVDAVAGVRERILEQPEWCQSSHRPDLSTQQTKPVT